jgi:hypothetical protein
MNQYVVLRILVTQIMIVLVYFLFWDLLMDLLLVMDLITIRKGYLSFFLCLYLMDNMDGLLLIFFVFFYILFVFLVLLRSLFFCLVSWFYFSV